MSLYSTIAASVEPAGRDRQRLCTSRWRNIGLTNRCLDTRDRQFLNNIINNNIHRRRKFRLTWARNSALKMLWGRNSICIGWMRIFRLGTRGNQTRCCRPRGRNTFVFFNTLFLARRTIQNFFESRHKLRWIVWNNLLAENSGDWLGLNRYQRGWKSFSLLCRFLLGRSLLHRWTILLQRTFLHRSLLLRRGLLGTGTTAVTIFTEHL